MDTDNLIAEAFTPSADAQPQADATTPEVQETPQAEAPEAPAADPKEEVFPKKAVNAITRRDRQIGRLKAELDALRANQPKQEPPKAQPAKDGEPQESDFNSYHDYSRALNKYDAEQLLKNRDAESQKTQQSAYQQRWVAERESVVEKQADAFIAQHPEAVALVHEYSDVIDAFPPHIEIAFLEADNAPLAFYNLAKEGKLEALLSMSPARAAMEIGMAQAKAPSRPVSKAPAPMTPVKGNTPSGKSLNSLSIEETLKWAKS